MSFNIFEHLLTSFFLLLRSTRFWSQTEYTGSYLEGTDKNIQIFPFSWDNLRLYMNTKLSATKQFAGFANM
jgi:hypothetical protein